VTATPAAAGATGAGARPFGDNIQVFAPHRAHLPPLGPYLREFWARRRFAYELSRTTQRASHFDTALGALWLVLNPLLLGVVYFLLVSVISGGGTGDWVTGLGRILIGIFTWYYAQNAMSIGAGSVTAGGGLILNQAFPRTLLPLSSVVTSAMMFLPSIPVFFVYYIIGSHTDTYVPAPGNVNTATAVHHMPGLTWALLWVPVLLAIMTVEIFGLAMIFATMSVYFRDTNKFLGYFLRIWLYLTPVLYDMNRFLEGHELKKELLLYLNPLGPVIGSITRCWIDGIGPSRTLLLACVGWAVVLLVAGGYFFISRERDFAVRI
jgi:teichoic acid transport system permease protein